MFGPVGPVVWDRGRPPLLSRRTAGRGGSLSLLPLYAAGSSPRRRPDRQVGGLLWRGGSPPSRCAPRARETSGGEDRGDGARERQHFVPLRWRRSGSRSSSSWVFLARSELDTGLIRENSGALRGGRVHDPPGRFRDRWPSSWCFSARSDGCRTTRGLRHHRLLHVVSRARLVHVELFLHLPALPQIGQIFGRLSLVNILTFTPFQAGVIGLGLNYGVYMTEIFQPGSSRSGTVRPKRPTPRDELRAAACGGLSSRRPTRVIIPPTGNEFIAMMKDTALVKLPGSEGRSRRALQLVQLNWPAWTSRNDVEALLIAAGMYWGLTAIFTFFQRKLERRMGRGDERGAATQRTPHLLQAGPGASGFGSGAAEIEVPEAQAQPGGSATGAAPMGRQRPGRRPRGEPPQVLRYERGPGRASTWRSTPRGRRDLRPVGIGQVHAPSSSHLPRGPDGRRDRGRGDPARRPDIGPVANGRRSGACGRMPGWSSNSFTCSRT